MLANSDSATNVRRSDSAERIFVGLCNRLRKGRLTIEDPRGSLQVFHGSEPGPYGQLRVRRQRFYQRVLLGGDIGFAEAFMDGDCDCDDLTGLIHLAAANEGILGRILVGHPVLRFGLRLAHLLRPNSKRGSKRNIARHYDLGNDFYGAWLDRTMTYSAGLFREPGWDLAQAQHEKYRRIAERAGLESHHHVLEIGCGWGGFAEYAAREIGCRVTAITISKAQYDFARRRIASAGHSEQVDVRFQDYRDLTGQFDRIVSIEMLEAVGENYWPAYFGAVRARLKPGGRAALQVITIDDTAFHGYRRQADFIQQYIFPGGMLPSRGALQDQANAASLDWLEDQGYGEDYAHTLSLWRRRFDEAWDRLASLGFDRRFRRMWTYYLAYSEAGFRAGRIDVLQLTLARS